MTEPGASAPSGLGARAVSNTLFILGARIVSRVVSLVVVLFLANSLGADGYGRYTTLIAFSALVSVVADLGFNPLYTREAARSPQELGHYLGTLMVLKVFLAAAALAWPVRSWGSSCIPWPTSRSISRFLPVGSSTERQSTS